MVECEWAIKWDAALAPPANMIPDESVFSPREQVETASAPENEQPDTALPWQDAALEVLAKIEEECGSAFQRDSLHIQPL